MALFAVMLLLLLAFVGLALDTGNLFLNQRGQQSAGDFAALSGATTLTSQLWSAPPAACSHTVTEALDAAALDGMRTAASTMASGCSGAPVGSRCYGPAESPGVQLDEVFYDWPLQSPVGSCPNLTSGWTYRVEVAVPPLNVANVSTDCLTAQWNCVEVIVQKRVRNYFEGIFGIPISMVRTDSWAYAEPSITNIANTSMPPATALMVSEPHSPGGFEGNANYPPNQFPSCAQILSGRASDVPYGLGSAGNTFTRRPALYSCQQLAILGVDSQNLNYAPFCTTAVPASCAGPGVDQYAVRSYGDVLLGSNLIVCDPFGRKQCPTNQLPSPDGNPPTPSYTVGAQGFVLDAGVGGPPRRPVLYCRGYDPPQGAPPYPCTNPFPRNPPNNDGLNLMQGNGVGAPASNHQAWPVVGHPSVVGLPNCGALVLNGGTVPRSACTRADPNNTANPNWTISPGSYQYIVINHGTYTFDPGVYDITSSTDHTQIDLTGETVQDVDLCPNVAASPCNNLRAGVWIGHGNGPFTGNYVPPSGTCVTGAVGPSGGGGDQTNVLGNGVTFVLESPSSHFVSTKEVNSIQLTAPNIGSSQRDAGIPLLFYASGPQYIHLDATTQSTATASGFDGIVYQVDNPGGGGVEMDTNIGQHKAPILRGQVFAYTFLSFGDDYGVGVDFSAGWGQPSSSAGVSTLGSFEGDIVSGQPSAIRGARGQPSRFIAHYRDEMPMDAYDISVSINGQAPIWYSRALWGSSGGPPFTAPPTPNPAAPAYPDDTPPGPPGTLRTGPIAPPANGSGSYSAGGGGTIFTPVNSPYSATVKITDTSVIKPGWVWGRSERYRQPTDSYTDDVEIDFIDPGISNLKLTITLVDGDACGDYSIARYGINTAGAVILEQ